MKANKYAKLLSDSIAANSTVKFHETQLNEFSKKTATFCAELYAKLESMQKIAAGFGDNPSLLQREQVDTLHAYIKELDQFNKSLHKDVEKPTQQFQKDLDKIGKDLNDRLLTTVNACAQPCEFDLNVIKSSVQSTLSIIATCKPKIDLCLKDIIRCQNHMARLEQSLRNLDLPNEIELATKQVVKISSDLERLNQQVQLIPSTRERFQREFLPLSSALANLRLQSKILAPEETISSASVPPTPRPGT